MIDSLARFLFDRQAAFYPGHAEELWLDREIRAFWVAEATAIAEHLGQSTRRRCATPGCRHAPSVHADDDGACSCGCPGWLVSKRHEWRDQVADSWRTATLTWLAERERVAIGYATEMRDFEALHPRPLLADHMRALSYGDEQVAS